LSEVRSACAAMADLQSLTVGCACESEAHGKVYQVTNFGCGSDRDADEVQVQAIGISAHAQP
jgi:hypothetical protein